MIKFLSISRSPATAAAGSAVLILAALVGVVLAASSAAEPSGASTQGTATSAPFNAAPLVLPKPCVATKHRQTCSGAVPKQHRAKQVKNQPAQPSAPPVPTAVPTAISP
jgi:hypothetical protein